jgi:excinuclease ABC subunit C
MDPLRDKIENLPGQPGVYLFKDEKGAILYIGKAGNLKHRISSYFQRPDGKEAKTLSLMERVADVETIVTGTEKEAFILENNLIKEHHPRYNIRLRDDKTYPLLKLSLGEVFPTLCIVRRAGKDGSLYFGPFPSATALRETLRLIRRLFPIRTCLDTKFTQRLRPCLNYGMGRCAGPCCGKIDPVSYREIVNQVRMFLEGKDRDLAGRLKEQMEEASRELRFEEAARIRDQIRHLDHVLEKQKIVSNDSVDQDVIGIHRRDNTILIYSLFVRSGKVLGGKGFNFSSLRLPDEEVLSSFLHQYYREGRLIPGKVLLPIPVPERELTESWLSDLKGEKVEVLVPERGDKKQLIRMACENAERYLLAQAEVERDQEELLLALKESLHLRRLPQRIEAFDISNLQGKNAVGSMVVFERGKAARDRYRRFKIKTIEGADDYGMMYEVLYRRYRKAVEGDDLPDLVLVDGGKGQLSMALEVFRELQIQEVDLLGLAKKKTIGGAPPAGFQKTEEKVFHPQYKEPLHLGRHTALLHFLDRVRDEAHRFAVTYHKKIRGKETVRSELGTIPGIGTTRQKGLLKFFGSVEKIREAPVEELSKAPGMNRTISQAVFKYFHPSSS